VGGQGAAGRPKLRVERQPFLASKAVIFGLNPTGPHILYVNLRQSKNCGFILKITQDDSLQSMADMSAVQIFPLSRR
jgi:hypothetical protein